LTAPSATRATVFGWAVRVYWEDTDGAGIVYHASYLRFMERARTEWLRHRGFEQGRLAREHGVLFTVSRLDLEYLLPGRLDDALVVEVALHRRGGASLSLAQAVRRDGGEILCRARVRIACVDAETLRPRPLPGAIALELENDR
jgi:acyl-CoA thioester hydrolase